MPGLLNNSSAHLDSITQCECSLRESLTLESRIKVCAGGPKTPTGIGLILVSMFHYTYDIESRSCQIH